MSPRGPVIVFHPRRRGTAQDCGSAIGEASKAVPLRVGMSSIEGSNVA